MISKNLSRIHSEIYFNFTKKSLGNLAHIASEIFSRVFPEIHLGNFFSSETRTSIPRENHWICPAIPSEKQVFIQKVQQILSERLSVSFFFRNFLKNMFPPEIYLSFTILHLPWIPSEFPSFFSESFQKFFFCNSLTFPRC